MGFISAPEFGWGRKVFEEKLAFDGAGSSRLVVGWEAVAVAAEDERDVEGIRVGESLLNARTDGVVVVLCFDDGGGNVRLEVEDVVGAFLRAAGVHSSSDANGPSVKPTSSRIWVSTSQPAATRWGVMGRDGA